MNSVLVTAIRAFCVGIGLLALLLSGCGADNYGPVEVLHADRGRIERDKDGHFRFTNSELIPLVEGEVYGWRMYIRTNKGKVRVTEEVTISGPTTWGGSSDLKVSADGRTVTKSRVIDGASGFVSSAWKITKEDPAGPVKIKVIIENKIEQQFNFTLKKP